jgi:hypothetical protein
VPAGQLQAVTGEAARGAASARNTRTRRTLLRHRFAIVGRQHRAAEAEKRGKTSWRSNNWHRSISHSGCAFRDACCSLLRYRHWSRAIVRSASRQRDFAAAVAGNGANGAANDLMIAWPPGRSAVIGAVYMSESQAEVSVLDRAHAEIGGLFAAAVARQ